MHARQFGYRVFESAFGLSWEASGDGMIETCHYHPCACFDLPAPVAGPNEVDPPTSSLYGLFVDR